MKAAIRVGAVTGIGYLSWVLGQELLARPLSHHVAVYVAIVPAMVFAVVAYRFVGKLLRPSANDN